MIWYEWMIRWIIGPGSTNPTAPSCSGHCLTHTAGLWASMFDGSKLREDASCEEVPWLMREFLGTEYGKNNAIYHPWLGMVYTPPIYGDLLGWLLLLFYPQLISWGWSPIWKPINQRLFHERYFEWLNGWEGSRSDRGRLGIPICLLRLGCPSPLQQGP